MKQKVALLLLFVISLTLLTGCGDRMYLEEMAITLVLGIDQDEEGNFIFYSSTPVFSENAKEQHNVTVTKAATVREAKEKLDIKENGYLSNGKVQSILIHKRVLENQDVFPYLDVFYRDAKNDINARVVAVEGSMDDMFYGRLAGNPQLAVVVKGMADQAEKKGYGISPRLSNYHRCVVDPRITPYMLIYHPNESEVTTAGTILLNKEGIAVQELNIRESMLLRLLKKLQKGPLSMTFRMNNATEKESMEPLQIEIRSVDYHVDTEYKKDHFAFTVEMDMEVDMSERIFSADRLPIQKIEQWVEQDLKQEFTQLLTKLQKNQLDPVGWGVYAQAFQYEQWKKVKHDWPKAWQQAEIQVIPRIHIRSEGVLI